MNIADILSLIRRNIVYETNKFVLKCSDVYNARPEEIKEKFELLFK